jgi:hypothetical protein
MNATDQLKLIKDGYTIIRERDYQRCLVKTSGPNTLYFIVAKGPGGHEWYQYEGPYPSKAARRRRMKGLLKDKKFIED